MKRAKKFRWSRRWVGLVFALLTMLAAPPISSASLDLLSEAKKSGMTFYWDSFASKGMLEKDDRVVLFRAEDSLLVFDYQAFALTDAPTFDKGRLMVTQKFLDSVNAFFASAAVPARPPANFSSYRVGAIVIDAGHGGSDPGTTAEHIINGKKIPFLEKEITLAVAKKLNTILLRAYPDKKIIMTRTTDTKVELEQRSDIANAVSLGEKEAILFVSIHVNSSPSAKATGFEVWYLPEEIDRQVLDPGGIEGDKILYNILNSMTQDEYIKESSLIAQSIMDGLNNKIGNLIPQRAIKEQAWAVVRNSKMPSVLVEIGFLSNGKEAALLIDPAHQQKTAQGIADGIDTFVRNFELSRGFTAKR